MKFFISAILIFAMAATGCAQYNGQILRTKSEGLTPAEKDALYQKVKVTDKNGDFYADGLSLPQDILAKHYEENGAYPNRAWTVDKIVKLSAAGLIAVGGTRLISYFWAGYANGIAEAIVPVAIAVPILISGLNWDQSKYAQDFNSFACEQIGAEHCENLSEPK